MKKTIQEFAQQFAFQPEILNAEAFKQKDYFIVCGMGGSHLAADLLKNIYPDLALTIHTDYGLPNWSDDYLKKSLVVLNSYSGNTEEVLDAFKVAQEKSLSIIIISTGGKLIDLAKENNLPYIEMPVIGIQPRAALGYNLRALLKVVAKEDGLLESAKLVDLLKPSDLENQGKDLAEKMRDFIPVIYSSLQNQALAYNWKIKFNETGKIPGFYNVVPELNHNEMNGFDFVDASKELVEKFCFVFLKDSEDDSRNQKRFNVLKKLYEDRGLKVFEVEFGGAEQNVFEKIFTNLILADWTAYHTAMLYGAESEQVPMVEEFKSLIK